MPPARPDPDHQVVLRARAGDPAAFELLVRHFQDRVHALAYRLTYDRELARDITQDVFLRLYEKFDRYDPNQPFTPWFLRLATNYALNQRQRAKIRKTHSLDAPVGDDEGKAPDPADAEQPTAPERAAADEERRVIRQAVRDLPDKYAGVVALHYLEGLSVKEISARLEMPVGTVKIRLYRGRDQLREALKRLDQQ